MRRHGNLANRGPAPTRPAECSSESKTTAAAAAAAAQRWRGPRAAITALSLVAGIALAGCAESGSDDDVDAPAAPSSATVDEAHEAEPVSAAVDEAREGEIAVVSQALAPSSLTMMNRNVRGSISGPANCSNFNFTSVSSKQVFFGTSYQNPAVKNRTISCTRGTTVVRGRLEMRGSYQTAAGGPTSGRDYRLHLSVEKNGVVTECGYTTTTSLLAGKVVNDPFPTNWSQLLRSAYISKSCAGSTATVSIDFSEGWSAP